MPKFPKDRLRPKDPSSTTWVATSALASRDQKSAATRPAWMAVSTTSAVEPCSTNEPVVRSCSGRVRKYKNKNIRNSSLPACHVT